MVAELVCGGGVADGVPNSVRAASTMALLIVVRLPSNVLLALGVNGIAVGGNNGACTFGKAGSAIPGAGARPFGT